MLNLMPMPPPILHQLLYLLKYLDLNMLKNAFFGWAFSKSRLDEAKQTKELRAARQNSFGI